jgi:hypothetical protein
VTAERPVKPGWGRTAWLVATAVLAAAWLGFLVFLATWTANPVTVNRAQLLLSDAVVVATPQPPKPQARSVSLRIEKVLAGKDVPEAFRVSGVEPARFSKAGRYLVPVRETGRGFIVTPAPINREGVPLVYPATEDALRVAEKILATAAAKPYE